MTDSKNQDLPFTIDDNHDGTFSIAYTPKSPGVHCISVLFGENEIPISPLKVTVEPTVDVNKIRVEGLETSKFFISIGSEKSLMIILFAFFFVCIALSFLSFSRTS